MEMEKAVAFTILPASWDETKSYCLKNYQKSTRSNTTTNNCHYRSNLEGMYTQFSLFSGEISIK